MARGRKTGGRRRGTPNKATIERALIAARAALESKSASKKLAKEILEDFMCVFVGMASHFQPAPPGTPRNPHADENKFWKCAEAAINCAVKLAPYQSPSLKAVAVVPQPVSPPSSPYALPDVLPDDPVELTRIYQQRINACRCPKACTQFGQDCFRISLGHCPRHRLSVILRV
jgi:hypothetical protein